MEESCVPPGFRFRPTEEELVGYYLKRKISSLGIDLHLITDIDLYNMEPWDIQGRDKAVLSRNTSSIIGMRKTLVFYGGRAPNGRKTDWIIHEYRLQTSQHAPPQPQEEGWVVCKAFKKPIPKERVGLEAYTYCSRIHQILPHECTNWDMTTNNSNNNPLLLTDPNPDVYFQTQTISTTALSDEINMDVGSSQLVELPTRISANSDIVSRRPLEQATVVVTSHQRMCDVLHSEDYYNLDSDWKALNNSSLLIAPEQTSSTSSDHANHRLLPLLPPPFGTHELALHLAHESQAGNYPFVSCLNDKSPYITSSGLAFSN
ncbi:hypothetical protein CRG98_017229 [Punica granatum]|uniref:NAC domain-containing protein n=1 Tax=Punica granatum TaxID=22663 RepID=A0A2I0K2T0_PUNGR|nr:hypothetical protein CRG98_017229 [Punica granatum]